MIALFDSGVGGISVLREIRALLPTANLVYYADSAHVPYGGRTAEDIRRLTMDAVRRLVAWRPSVIVIACNTATSTAIDDVRAAWPEVPIVGVVPVVKTLAERTQNRRVAVIATAATLRSETYVRLKNQFAHGLDVLEIAAPEWVSLVESGRLETPAATAAVANVTGRIRDFGADALALGSTHFPWLRRLIESELPGVHVLDSGPAVARQVVRVMSQNRSLPGSEENGTIRWLCSGDPAVFAATARRLFGSDIAPEAISG